MQDNFFAGFAELKSDDLLENRQVISRPDDDMQANFIAGYLEMKSEKLLEETEIDGLLVDNQKISQPAAMQANAEAGPVKIEGPLVNDQIIAQPSNSPAAMHIAAKAVFTMIKKESTAAKRKAKYYPREASTAFPENVESFAYKIDSDCSEIDFGYGNNQTDAN